MTKPEKEQTTAICFERNNPLARIYTDDEEFQKYMLNQGYKPNMSDEDGFFFEVNKKLIMIKHI